MAKKKKTSKKPLFKQIKFVKKIDFKNIFKKIIDIIITIFIGFKNMIVAFLKYSYRNPAKVFIPLAIVLLLGYGAYSFFIGEIGNPIYGDRCADLPKIEEKLLLDVEKSLINNELVNDASVRLSCALIYITADFEKNVEIQTAEKVLADTLTFFSDEIKEAYEIQFIANKSDTDENTTGFPHFGSKRKASKAIMWAK